MNRFRFSISSVLAVVTLLAAGLGAMASRSQLAASLALTVFLSALALATAVALVRRAANRTFWIGFSVFGWMYWFGEFTLPDSAWTRSWQSAVYAAGASPPPPQPTGLITGEFIRFVEANVTPNRSPGAQVMALWPNNGRYYRATIVETLADGMVQVQWAEGGGLQATPASQIIGDSPQLVVAGHSLMGGMFGLLGGMLAAWVAGRRRTKNDAASAKTA
jgi:hypothetical protein